jgi:hypothetical protein
MSNAPPNPEIMNSFDKLLEIGELTRVTYEPLSSRIMAMTGGRKAQNPVALGLIPV